jgi:hypothetical protein
MGYLVIGVLVAAFIVVTLPLIDFIKEYFTDFEGLCQAIRDLDEWKKEFGIREID